VPDDKVAAGRNDAAASDRAQIGTLAAVSFGSSCERPFGRAAPEKTERAYPVQGAGRDVIPPPGKRCAVKRSRGEYSPRRLPALRVFSAEAARLCEKNLNFVN